MTENVHTLQTENNVMQLILIQEFQEVINKHHDKVTLIDIIGAIESIKLDNYINNVLSD